MALALLVELSQPVGLSDTSTLDVVDSIYDPPDTSRKDRLAFVIAAGGEL